jgi:hypothetical protein
MTSDVSMGFLCPICHRDMQGQMELMTHFETAHNENAESIQKKGLSDGSVGG